MWKFRYFLPPSLRFLSNHQPHIIMVLKLLQGDVRVISWAEQQVNSYPVDFDAVDGETSPTYIQSNLNVALLDIVKDVSISVSSIEQNISLEDYLERRWSRSSSFNVSFLECYDRSAWENIGALGPRENLAEAVNFVINLLGMHPFELLECLKFSFTPNLEKE